MQPQEQAPRQDAPRRQQQGPRGYSAYRHNNMDPYYPFDGDMMFGDEPRVPRDTNMMPPPFMGGPGPYDFEFDGFPGGPVGMDYYFDMEFNNNNNNNNMNNGPFGFDARRYDTLDQRLPPPIPRLPAKPMSSSAGSHGTVLSSHHMPYGKLDRQRRQEPYEEDDVPRSNAAAPQKKKYQRQQSRSVELGRESSGRRSGLVEDDDDFEDAQDFDVINRRKQQPSARQWGLDEDDDLDHSKHGIGVPDDSASAHYDEERSGPRKHLFETSVASVEDDFEFGLGEEEMEDHGTYHTRQVERPERPTPPRPEPKQQEPPKPKVVVLSNNPSLVGLSSFLGTSETPRKGLGEVPSSLYEDEVEEDEITKHTSSARKYMKNKHRETMQKAKEAREKKRLKLQLEATRKQLLSDAILLLNQDSSVTKVLGSDIELLDNGEPFSEKTSVASSNNVFVSDSNPRTTYGFRVGGSKHTGIVQLVTLRNSNFEVTDSAGIMITQLTVEGGGRRIPVKLNNGASNTNNGKPVPISKKKQNPVFQRPSTNRDGGFSQQTDVIQGASDSIIDGVIEIAAKEETGETEMA